MQYNSAEIHIDLTTIINVYLT